MGAIRISLYFMLRGGLIVVTLCAAVWGVNCGSRTTSMETFNTRQVILPNGKKIRAEVLVRPEDLMRGMMFREELPEDRGMLFLHDRAGSYPYWMYQVRIPLDIIWMDANRRIVELVADAPPCRGRPQECPSYGGTVESLIVLELAAGSIQRHGLRVGQALEF